MKSITSTITWAVTYQPTPDTTMGGSTEIYLLEGRATLDDVCHTCKRLHVVAELFEPTSGRVVCRVDAQGNWRFVA
jgi:hypothetical protein